MERIDQVGLESVSDTHSTISLMKTSLQWAVPGIVLEDQFRLNEAEFLVITSDDCPFEESLHILLINKNMSEYERVDIELDNTPGIFKDCIISRDDSVQFKFIADNTYRIDVDSAASISWNRIFSSFGISYKNPLKKKRLNVNLLPIKK